MRIQNDHGLFISDGATKQFKFVVSRITCMRIMTTFEINYRMYKSLEVSFHKFPQEVITFNPVDISLDNPKCILTVELHEEWYYKILKIIYDKGRYDVVLGLALEFNKN